MIAKYSIFIYLALSFIVCQHSRGQIIGLGKLDNANWSQARDVSNNGVVVGRSSSEAFRWTLEDGMEAIGNLPGSIRSEATNVSADGTAIVVRNTFYDADSGLSSVLFRWTRAGGIQDLGSLEGSTSAGATGISYDGTVISGAVSTTGVSSSSRAFRWTADEGMQAIMDPLDLPRSSGAGGMSADGLTIVGAASWTSTEAFKWTSDGGIERLPELPGGDSYGAASRVSNDGSVIVGTSIGVRLARESVRWTDAGVEGIDPTNLLFYNTYIFDLSGDGSLIVGQYDDGVRNEAFVWDEIYGIQSLYGIL